MKNSILRKQLALLVIALVGSTVFANGQTESPEKGKLDYPTENITITNPYKAGGAVDVICREIANLSKGVIAKPVVVTNRTGASGVIATTEFVSKKPNSHDIIMMSRSIMVTVPTAQKVKYTYADIKPVIGLENVDFILFVSAKNKNIDTLEKLMEYADTHTVTYGTSGVGTDMDLIEKGLFKNSKTPAKAVVFGGAVDALTNVVAGNIDVTVAPPAGAKSFFENGDLIPLGIFSDKPYTGYKGTTIKTMKEQGVDISFPGLNFLAVQAETDDAVVNYLYTKFKQICDSPEYQTFVKNSNIDYCPMSPSEIDAYIKNQQAVAAKLSD